MSQLYIPEQQDSPNLRKNYFAYSTVGTLDVLGATFGETLYYNPTNAAFRMGEMFFYGDSGKELTADQWRESEYFREGLTVGDTIYEGAASILAERYDERKARRITLERSRGGLGLGVAQFGVGLVGSVLDPLNVASAFIPVAGAARYASLAAKYGKTRARAIVGVQEGAVGAAVVEPLVVTAAAIEQDDDYTMVDSLMNVAFGSALGGGLHVGVGKISDALNKAKPDTREVLTRTAVAQAASGRDVNVKPIIDASPELRNNYVFRGERIIREEVGPVPDFKPETKGSRYPDVIRPFTVEKEQPRSLTGFIRDIGKISTAERNKSEVTAIFDKDRTIFKKDGRTLDEIGEAAFEAGYFDERPTVAELVDAIREDKTGTKIYSAKDIDKVQAMSDAEALVDEAVAAGIPLKGLTDEQFLEAIAEYRSRVEPSELVPEDAPEGMTEEEFYRLLERTQVDVADYPELNEFRQRMDDMLAEVDEYDGDDLERIMSDIEELTADVRIMDEDGLIPDVVKQEIAATDRLIEKAERGYDDATRAGANCLFRNK